MIFLCMVLNVVFAMLCCGPSVKVYLFVTWQESLRERDWQRGNDKAGGAGGGGWGCVFFITRKGVKSKFLWWQLW